MVNDLHPGAYPNIAGVSYESMVDGEGIRTAIFLSGCRHNCPGCQNREAQDPAFGMKCTIDVIETIADEIAKRKPFLSGITLTGGDPLLCPRETGWFLAMLAASLLRRGMELPDVWMYTGYTLDEVLKSKAVGLESVLMYVHILVDGRFEQDRADKRLAFRGSSNQRIWEQKGGGVWRDATSLFDQLA